MLQLYGTSPSIQNKKIIAVTAGGSQEFIEEKTLCKWLLIYIEFPFLINGDGGIRMPRLA